jgi:hypothetical protein
MTSTIWSTDVLIQGGGKSTGNATTAPTTTQRPSATTNQAQAGRDAAAGARDLSDAIRANVQRELNAAGIQGAIAGGVAGGVQDGVLQAPPAPPAPPDVPQASHTFTIRGPDGTQVITIPPHAFDNTIPPQVEDISIMFFLTIGAIIIFLPLVRAFARRMDRRGGGTAQIPNEVSSQLAQLNQAVDAIALEVERISEGQRFTTRLLSEQRDARQTLGSGLK